MTGLSAALVLLSFLSLRGDPGRMPFPVRIFDTLPEAARPGDGPVLLVFFSTDCPRCYEDLIEARYLVRKAGWSASVVGVTSGPLDDLRGFLEKHGWSQPVIHDRKRALFRRFKVDMVPYKVVLVGGRTAYLDDPYETYDRRWEVLKKCLKRICSR